MTVQSFTTDDGCRIAYRFDGPEDGPVLLLSNSLGTTMEMWDPQMAAFTARFRVLRYDSRGHGQSDSPAGGYSMDRLGRDAVQLLDAVGVAQTDFCGLSKGGMIGQWLGVRAPERIRKLILANTSAYMGPPSGWQSRISGVLAEGMTPLAEASIGRWFTPEFPSQAPRAIAPIRVMLLACDRQGYAGCCAAIRDMDMRAMAPLIRPPVLVIAGTQDPSTSVADGRWLADTVRDGRMVELAAAHLSNVERPDDFAQVVLAFLWETGLQEAGL